jgi:S1-C subfamily serine protease
MMRRAIAILLTLAWWMPQPVEAGPIEDAMRSVVSVLPEWPPDAARSEEPEGSGVVVLDGRTILTAAHIVNKALSVHVRTSEGDILPAKIGNRDLSTDLAILRIEETLPAIPVDLQDPTLGAKVCTIGNAFGLGLSVTCGVVSGIHRAGIGFNPVEDFVQTDAAVNPGASGGALIDEDGEMIGLLSAIFTKTSDANIGVNFAVSAPLAIDVAAELNRETPFRRPISGLRLEQAPEKGETGRLGARVDAMRPGLMGERAGFAVGDVIIRAGKRRVRKPADFVSAIAAIKAGDTMEIEIVRGGENRILRLAP